MRRLTSMCDSRAFLSAFSHPSLVPPSLNHGERHRCRRSNQAKLINISLCSTLTANIRRRRGSKVAMNMPIFFDDNTPKPFIDPTVPRDRNDWPEDASASAFPSSPSSLPPFLLLLILPVLAQTPVRVPLSPITSTWTRWVSGWVAAAFRSRSRRAPLGRRGGCTMRLCPLVR